MPPCIRTTQGFGLSKALRVYLKCQVRVHTGSLIRIALINRLSELFVSGRVLLCALLCAAVTWHLPLWYSMRFLAAHFSVLLRSLWAAAPPSGMSATPLRSVRSAILLRVHSAPSPTSLMKVLNKSGHSGNPWPVPLITDLQLDFCHRAPPCGPSPWCCKRDNGHKVCQGVALSQSCH